MTHDAGSGRPLSDDACRAPGQAALASGRAVGPRRRDIRSMPRGWACAPPPTCAAVSRGCRLRSYRPVGIRLGCRPGDVGSPGRSHPGKKKARTPLQRGPGSQNPPGPSRFRGNAVEVRCNGSMGARVAEDENGVKRENENPDKYSRDQTGSGPCRAKSSSTNAIETSACAK